MANQFDTRNLLFPTVEAAVVFYANQAQRIQDDPAMAEAFQASCETAEILLRLHKTVQGRPRHAEIEWSQPAHS
jgi:hypothetical protein